MYHVFFYECGTSCLTLNEENWLRAFENGVPRKIFGPQSDEVKEECKILHKTSLYDLYFSPSITSMRTSRNVARMGRREIHTGF